MEAAKAGLSPHDTAAIQLTGTGLGRTGTMILEASKVEE